MHIEFHFIVKNLDKLLHGWKMTRFQLRPYRHIYKTKSQHPTPPQRNINVIPRQTSTPQILIDFHSQLGATKAHASSFSGAFTAAKEPLGTQMSPQNYPHAGRLKPDAAVPGGAQSPAFPADCQGSTAGKLGLKR